MKIVVVTSCTASKRFKVADPLTKEEFADPKRRAARQAAFANAGKTCPAEDMYTGWQHEELMRGLRILHPRLDGNAIDLRILSAGYGLIPSGQRVAPYECTFEKMSLLDALAWADTLSVRASFDQVVRDANLCFLLLGSRYLRVLRLAERYDGPRLIAFASEKDKCLLPKESVIVPAGKEEAIANRCGLIGLKGYLFRCLAENALELGAAKVLKDLAKRPERVNDLIGAPRPSRARRFCALSTRASYPPARERAKTNLVERPLFYLPDWDDRVDPKYIFESDTHTPERDPYRDDRYAHELYEAPVTDGMLVSRPVLEKTAQKIDEAHRVGIHAYLRLPKTVPILGDCGAFVYLKDTNPPYDPQEMVEYYDALGFDLGVSVDHLIVRSVVTRSEHYQRIAGSWQHIAPETFETLVKEGVRRATSKDDCGPLEARAVLREEYIDWKEVERRYTLTIDNAEKFFKAYSCATRRFEAVGVVQGFVPDQRDPNEVRRAAAFSHAAAATRLAKMGYKYIAIGGLVRSRDSDVIRIVRAVRESVGDKIKIHVFGVARESVLNEFRRCRVTSADSAGPLRQAWLSATKNYTTSDDRNYVAIRVPFSSSKRHEASQAARRAESAALDALRAYDDGKVDLEATLKAVKHYATTLDRQKLPSKLLDKYRRTLQDRPWSKCSCRICKAIKIEVVIFRANNRNRRRGFHNVRTFFERFKDSFKTGTPAPGNSGEAKVKGTASSRVTGAGEGPPVVALCHTGAAASNL